MNIYTLLNSEHTVIMQSVSAKTCQDGGFVC